MTLKRKIQANLLLTAMVAPGMLIFNLDVENLYINIIGFAYIVLLVHLLKRKAPKVVREWFDHCDTEMQ